MHFVVQDYLGYTTSKPVSAKTDRNILNLPHAHTHSHHRHSPAPIFDKSSYAIAQHIIPWFLLTAPCQYHVSCRYTTFNTNDKQFYLHSVLLAKNVPCGNLPRWNSSSKAKQQNAFMFCVNSGSKVGPPTDWSYLMTHCFWFNTSQHLQLSKVTQISHNNKELWEEFFQIVTNFYTKCFLIV